MRVIGGTAGSIRLKAPKGIRPTTDAMRETLFNVLGGRVRGARFLDLFAGSGAVGIEALSRGAAHCTFVERDPACVRALAVNLERTGLSERTVVMRRDAAQVLRELGADERHDIAFVDPPYQFEGLGEVLGLLLEQRAGVSDAAVVVVQHSRGDEAVEGLEPTRAKPFGDSVLSFFE